MRLTKTEREFLNEKNYGNASETGFTVKDLKRLSKKLDVDVLYATRQDLLDSIFEKWSSDTQNVRISPPKKKTVRCSKKPSRISPNRKSPTKKAVRKSPLKHTRIRLSPECNKCDVKADIATSVKNYKVLKPKMRMSKSIRYDSSSPVNLTKTKSCRVSPILRSKRRSPVRVRRVSPSKSASKVKITPDKKLEEEYDLSPRACFRNTPFTKECTTGCRTDGKPRLSPFSKKRTPCSKGKTIPEYESEGYSAYYIVNANDEKKFTVLQKGPNLLIFEDYSLLKKFTTETAFMDMTKRRVYSMLVKLTDLNYLYIGRSIYEFVTFEHITYFLPSALDSYAMSQNSIYMFDNEIVLNNSQGMKVNPGMTNNLSTLLSGVKMNIGARYTP
jgi:hypothetical protein